MYRHEDMGAMATAHQFVNSGLVAARIFAQLLREPVAVVTSPCPRASVGFKVDLTGQGLGKKRSGAFWWFL